MFKAFLAISLLIQASFAAERLDDPQYKNCVKGGATKMVCGALLVAANAAFFGIELKKQLEINQRAEALLTAPGNVTIDNYTREISTISQASAFMPAFTRTSAIGFGLLGIIHGGWMVFQGAKEFPFFEALERFKTWFRTTNQAGNTEEDPLIVDSIE